MAKKTTKPVATVKKTPATKALKTAPAKKLPASTLDMAGLGAAFSDYENFSTSSLQQSGNTTGDANGKPLALPLASIVEDPDQPRKYFDDETLDELAASIKIHGVMSPISVRSANADGHYQINFGARRLRAAGIAGLTEIPAIINDEQDHYSQMVENIQRGDLRPMDTARFIAGELAKGEKAVSIAKRLGKNKSWVSEYQSLNALPGYIIERADAGDIRDSRTLTELGRLIKKTPDAVREFIDSTPGVITRSDVKTGFNPAVDPAPKPTGSNDDNNHDLSIGKQTAPNENERTDASKPVTGPSDRTSIGGGGRSQSDSSGGGSSKEPADEAPTFTVTDPLLMVLVDGRGGVLRLDITGDKGHGWVEYGGTEKPVYVDLATVTITQLIGK